MTLEQLLARVNAQIEATTPEGVEPRYLTMEAFQALHERRQAARAARSATIWAPREPEILTPPPPIEPVWVEPVAPPPESRAWMLYAGAAAGALGGLLWWLL